MALDLEQLIQAYGYWAVLGGTSLEGETILILAGFAAHRGYLHLPWLIGAAFLGTLAGDQLFFYLSRWHAAGFLAGRPTWALRVEQANRLIDRHETLIILVFRFLYGLRTVILSALGASRVSARRFVALNRVSWG